MARTVTGTVKYPDGTAWASASVYFELVDAFETSTTVYPRRTHTETTDVNGAFTVDLAVPDTGTAHYQCRLPDDSAFHFYLAAGAAVDLVTLITVAGTSVSQDEVQTALDAAAVLTMRSLTTTGAIVATDDYVDCTGTFALTLPLATGSGVAYIVDNISTGIITVTRAGADTIEGATTKLVYAGDSMTFLDRSAGNWQVLGG